MIHFSEGRINVTFETSEAFGITNVQIQFILSYHSRREERILKQLFYFEMRWVVIISCNVGSFGCRNNVE